MPRQTSLLGSRAPGSSSSSRARGGSNSASPMAAFDNTRRPMYSGGRTRYMSPWCPQLRTKAWLTFHGLPPHLCTERTCRSAVAGFGGLVRFAAPPPSDYEDGGRVVVVVEARITRPQDVPRRIEARHHLGFGHVLAWPVDVQVLAYAPVGDDDEAAPPGDLVMWCCDPEEGVVDDDVLQVGKPKKRATIPAPKPEEYAGILDGRGEASGAVERPESGICQAFAD